MMTREHPAAIQGGSCPKGFWELKFFFLLRRSGPVSTFCKPNSDPTCFGFLGDIFESFSSHPPLILPLGSSRLRLTGPVTDDALHRELRRLRRLLWDLEQQELPANHRHGPPATTPS